MNIKALKTISVAVCLVAGMGVASPAMATSTGLQSLVGSLTSNSIDVWTFTCPALFPRGRATVQDNNPPFDPTNRLQVVLGKAGFISNQVQDNSGLAFTGGEGGATSFAATVNGTAGLYVATFKKTVTSRSENYVGDLYCVNLFGFRSNPAIARQINQ